MIRIDEEYTLVRYGSEYILYHNNESTGLRYPVAGRLHDSIPCSNHINHHCPKIISSELRKKINFIAGGHNDHY